MKLRRAHYSRLRLRARCLQLPHPVRQQRCSRPAVRQQRCWSFQDARRSYSSSYRDGHPRPKYWSRAFPYFRQSLCLASFPLHLQYSYRVGLPSNRRQLPVGRQTEQSQVAQELLRAWEPQQALLPARL